MDGPVIHHVERGRGLPVILLHGFANDGLLWMPQLEALGHRFRLIAPDLRGFGQSMDADGRAVTMDRYADDVVALMDHLHIPRAVVGGISLGGYVTLSLALRHPARVAALVLANTRAGADNPEWASYREALVRDVEQRGARAVVENFGDKPFRDEAPEEVKATVRKSILRQRAGGLASATRGMAARPDRFPALASIAVPTLVVTGTEDKYIPVDEARAMHAAIPGSRLVVIEHGGHLSNVDQPEAFSAALEDFLDALR